MSAAVHAFRRLSVFLFIPCVLLILHIVEPVKLKSGSPEVKPVENHCYIIPSVKTGMEALIRTILF